MSYKSFANLVCTASGSQTTTCQFYAMIASRCFAGQKGSDVSARESTRKIVAASRQLEALQSILNALGVAPASSTQQPPIQNNRVNEAYWTPKNTIVRDVLNEIGNQHRHA